MNDEEVLEIAKALQPPRCPNCGKELDHLLYVEKAINQAKFFSNDYWSWDTVDVQDSWYECPWCLTKICDSQEDANKFLGDKEE